MVSNQNNTEIIFYTIPEGNIKIDTLFQNETIWLTQKKMADLFDVNVPAISKHLKGVHHQVVCHGGGVIRRSLRLRNIPLLCIVESIKMQ